MALTEIQFPRTFLHVDEPNPRSGAPPPITAQSTQYEWININLNRIPKKTLISSGPSTPPLATGSTLDPVPQYTVKKKKLSITQPAISQDGVTTDVPRKYTKNMKTHKVIIPAGLYANVKALVDTVNKTEAFKDHMYLEYNEAIGGVVSLKRVPDRCVIEKCVLPHLICLDDKLSKALGFEPRKIMDIHKQSKFIAD